MWCSGLVKVKQCGLCGLEFEEHNLPGVVSFQAIANLRKRYVLSFNEKFKLWASNEKFRLWFIRAQVGLWDSTNWCTAQICIRSIFLCQTMCLLLSIFLWWSGLIIYLNMRHYFRKDECAHRSSMAHLIWFLFSRKIGTTTVHTYQRHLLFKLQSNHAARSDVHTATTQLLTDRFALWIVVLEFKVVMFSTNRTSRASRCEW